MAQPSSVPWLQLRPEQRIVYTPLYPQNFQSPASSRSANGQAAAPPANASAPQPVHAPVAPAAAAQPAGIYPVTAHSLFPNGLSANEPQQSVYAAAPSPVASSLQPAINYAAHTFGFRVPAVASPASPASPSSPESCAPSPAQGGASAPKKKRSRKPPAPKTYLCDKCTGPSIVLASKADLHAHIRAVHQATARLDDGEGWIVTVHRDARGLWKCVIPKCKQEFDGDPYDALKKHWMTHCRASTVPRLDIKEIKDEPEEDDDIVFIGMTTRRQVNESIGTSDNADSDDDAVERELLGGQYSDTEPGMDVDTPAEAEMSAQSQNALHEGRLMYPSSEEFASDDQAEPIEQDEPADESPAVDPGVAEEQAQMQHAEVPPMQIQPASPPPALPQQAPPLAAPVPASPTSHLPSPPAETSFPSIPAASAPAPPIPPSLLAFLDGLSMRLHSAADVFVRHDIATDSQLDMVATMDRAPYDALRPFIDELIARIHWRAWWVAEMGFIKREEAIKMREALARAGGGR